jgi:hypothetical protein
VKAITISEASRASGISRGTLYRALKDGRLAKFEVLQGTRRMLLPAAVPYLRSGAIRPRADSPWFGGDAARAAADAPEPDNGDLLPECWDDPDADWQQFSEAWGRWQPESELSTAEYWQQVAALMRGWMADPLPPINGTTAPSWYRAATDAADAVNAGFRWDADQWAKRAAELDAEFGVTPEQ